MEQLTTFLFFAGAFFFVVFTTAAANIRNNGIKYEDLDAITKTEVTVYMTLSLLGAIAVLTGCVLEVINYV